MADFAMCKNKDCEKSQQCKRFIGIPNDPYKSYVDFEHICGEKYKYKWFWKADLAIQTNTSNQESKDK